MRKSFFLQSFAAFALAVSQMALAQADFVRAEQLAVTVDGAGQAISQTVRADQKSRYLVSADEGQTLSVDLLSQSDDVHFNIAAADSDFPMHASSLDGRVADIVVPESGEYVVEVYLDVDASDSNQAGASERAIVTVGLYGQDSTQALLDGPDFWAVTGLKEGVALNLRAGPSTRYPAVGQLESGLALQNNGCRLTQGKRWCFVRVPSLEAAGWVAAQFLIAGQTP